MALFEIDNGRLVPAQFGFNSKEGLPAHVLDALRAQILEVIGRPLFPVSWHGLDETAAEPDGGPRRLIALDASGQVVSVEIMQTLDAVSLIEALTRLGDSSSKGWLELASEYPGGPEEFRAGWAQFREAMPATVQPGPRLIIVTGRIESGVESALETLSKSGLEVHRVGLRQMSNGRQFIQSELVDFLRAAGTRLALASGSAQQVRAQIAAAVQDEPLPFTQAQVVVGTAVQTGYGPGHVDAGVYVAAQAPETITTTQVETTTTAPEAVAMDVEVTVNTTPVAQTSNETATAPSENAEAADLNPATSDRQPQTPDHPLGQLPTAVPATPEETAQPTAEPVVQPEPEYAATPEYGSRRSETRNENYPHGQHFQHDAHGLAAIAESCGDDVPVFFRDVMATLRATGVIDCGDGTITQDPAVACESLELVSDSPWDEWVIGDPDGPTLAEAIAELNEA